MKLVHSKIKQPASNMQRQDVPGSFVDLEAKELIETIWRGIAAGLLPDAGCAMNPAKVRINDRKATAKRLVELVVPYVERHGTRVVGMGAINRAQPIRALIGALEINYYPKAARLSQSPPPHLLDIYFKGSGKVFSAWFNPVELVTIKPGQWLPDLFEYLEPGKCAA